MDLPPFLQLFFRFRLGHVPLLFLMAEKVNPRAARADHHLRYLTQEIAARNPCRTTTSVLFQEHPNLNLQATSSIPCFCA